MSTHPDPTPEVTAVRPPVNYGQLVASILAVLLLGTNLITWFYFQDQLSAKVPAAGDVAVQSDAATSAIRSTPAPQTPLSNAYKITNGHDHLYMLKHLDKYLKAAEKMGITRTVFVASSEFTFKGTGGDQKKLNDWSSKEILTAAKQHPGKIIPFVTLHPDDENKLELLKGYVAEGAMGLKLYTGHSNFHDRPMDGDAMEPVFAYCEETGLPVLWHVNMDKYAKELFSVLDKHPNLVAIIPHFGVGFWKPDGKVMDDVARMLDTYPNVYVDSSFGTREILVGGLEKVTEYTDIFKEFYAKYQDKIVWGTDMVVTGNSEKTEAWVESIIRACRDVHEKDHYTFWMAATGSAYAYPSAKNTYGELRGLNLPPEILKKVYETNIDKVLARVMK